MAQRLRLILALQKAQKALEDKPADIERASRKIEAVIIGLKGRKKKDTAATVAGE